jgi:hypothetical protein
VFFAVAGVTGAAAIAWGVCGVLALSSHGDFNDTSAQVSALPANDPTVPSLTVQASQQADAARRWALWSDIAMGVTLAGVVAGTILVLNTDFGGHRMNVAAGPTPEGAMFSLRGSF